MNLRLAILIVLLFGSWQAVNATELPVDASRIDQGRDNAVVDLWFFWSQQCPHCRDAHPVISKLDAELDWVKLHAMRVDSNPDNVAIYISMAKELGMQARSVPAFIFCGRMIVGWDKAGVTEQELRAGLVSCRGDAAEVVLPTGEPLNLPVLGEVYPNDWSLPLLTVLIAGLDSFNPCAFFVLLFLLSLLVHAGSRWRMFAVGGLFILVSGAVYFVSMSAWLNLFAYIGHLSLVTLIAGLVAVVISVINIKDYFLFKQGVSLTIDDNKQGKLIQRMRALLQRGSLTAMLTATLTLAIFANLYELLCTAGFPMVYTRLLTLTGLSLTQYYLYLLLYAVVYVIPLMLIMMLFVVTLGQRKLQEHEGRVLKLQSGIMMLALGMVLIIAPEALSNLWLVFILLPASIAITWLVTKIAPMRGSTTG